MPAIRSSVFVSACVALVLLAAPVSAQPPDPAATSAVAPTAAPEKELTIGNGLQVLHGKIDAVALNTSIDWNQQFRRSVVDLTVNATSQLAGGQWTRTANANWINRWASVTSHGRRPYPMTHVWLQHDESLGVDLRATAGAGLGSHLVNRPKLNVTLEGGVGHTIEEVTDRDGSYITFFGGPLIRWTVNERVSVTSHSLLYENQERKTDVRINSEFDMNVQLTKYIGMQNQVLYFYDREPVTGFPPNSVQASVNLTFSLRSGPPAQK